MLQNVIWEMYFTRVTFVEKDLCQKEELKDTNHSNLPESEKLKCTH